MELAELKDRSRAQHRDLQRQNQLKDGKRYAGKKSNAGYI